MNRAFEEAPDMTGSQITMWVMYGLLVWTLAEYLIHRFLFHGEDTWMKYFFFNKYVYTFHFLVHGIHHAFP